MTIRSLFGRLAFVAALMWSCASAPAADTTPPAPLAVGAAPVVVGDGGCATCQGGTPAVKSGCATCGKLPLSNLFKKTPNPYPVHLCPGACFGYFQTQWRKWDEVCPYPYLGMGASDAGRTPGSLPATKSGGGELPPPRSVEPKTNDPKAGGTPELPGIPPVNPGGK